MASQPELETCSYCGAEIDDPDLNPYTWDEAFPYCDESCYELAEQDKEDKDA